jgi:hypothetical protein
MTPDDYREIREDTRRWLRKNEPAIANDDALPAAAGAWIGMVLIALLALAGLYLLWELDTRSTSVTAAPNLSASKSTY